MNEVIKEGKWIFENGEWKNSCDKCCFSCRDICEDYCSDVFINECDCCGCKYDD